ncbi:unnamed protein product [Schistosoma rodhaini]|nr:unnamed protein product [Schistosoma rodhaini]
MDKKLNTTLFHPALINLTTHLFHNIIEHKINTQNFKCLGLQSIDYEQKENQIEVVLQFDIISSSSSSSSLSSSSSSSSTNNSLVNNNNTYTECDYTNLFVDKLTEQITPNERKSPFVAIVVCCCILTTFFLLVLFLRCRSFIRRKQLLKRRRNPKYLYCSKYPKSKPINHCYIKANNSCYWSPAKPKHSNSFSVWSENQPLKYHPNKHRISSISSLNQSSSMINSIQQSRFYQSKNYSKDSNCIHHLYNSSNNVINNSNDRNFMKYNYHQHGDICGTGNHMNTGYLEHCKRINNTKSTMMYPNSQRLIVPSKQSNPLAKGNQPMFFNSQKITNENEITDSETPTTEFTESSKSHKSISQINVYRKGRSLSPADITNSKESKFLFSPKPRFSLAESDEMNDQPIENSQSSGFRDVIIDCSSLESAISYPVQNSYSHLNGNKNLDSSLESRTYQSLMSVYLNDVAQKNRIITPTVTITTTSINNTLSENNISTNHNICLDNSNYNKVITLPPLNIPNTDTGIINDGLYNTEKMNSFESNQSTFSINIDHDHIEQHNNFTYDLQSPMIKEKSKRPVLCLFSANQYNQKRHLKRNNSITIDDNHDDNDINDDNNNKNGNIHDVKQDIDVRRLRQSTNITTTKLSVNNQINRITGSSNNINNNNDNICNHNLHLLLSSTNECKSCVNLQAYELSQDRYRNPSSGSTVSQIPRSDLPDVYLNSQRSSLCGRSRMELLYVDNELDRTNKPRCKLSTNGIISSSNLGENLSDVIDSDHCFSVQHANGAGDNWSLVDELVIFPQPQTLGFVRNQTFNAKNTYHQPLPQPSLNLAPSFFKPYQLTDDNFGNLPVKDKEHHISIQQQLRRALSLSSRRKSPRSLNEEIQSIMDKHYEMTGIRMTIGSGSSQKNSTTTKSYINLFGLQTGNKTQPSRPRKRRCSWTFTKDITNEFQTSLKNVSSALHLDCPTFDLFQKKFKPNREKPSVLESLSMTALPCLIPLRPRIQSDATNDMTSINEEFIERRPERKFHSDLNNIKLIDFRRNSMVTNDKSVFIYGIEKNIRLVKTYYVDTFFEIPLFKHKG